jgi:hypothetical protein
MISIVFARVLAAITLLSIVPLAAPQNTKPEPVTDRRTWDIAVWGGGSTGEENHDDFSEGQILRAGVFVGRTLFRDLGKGWMRGDLEWGFNLAPVFVTFNSQNIYGAGFDPIVARWNFAHKKGRISPYFELVGGGTYTNSELPTGDTSSFNFTATGGGGIYLDTRPSQALDLGCRWLHVSNANLGARNPEFNGIEILLGYHWFK